jgi:hypothetical protein
MYPRISGDNMADYFEKSVRESCSVKQKSFRALRLKLL